MTFRVKQEHAMTGRAMTTRGRDASMANVCILGEGGSLTSTEASEMRLRAKGWRIHAIAVVTAVVAGTFFAGAAWAAPLPDDPRLAPVRSRLVAVVDKATADGLSPELIEIIVRKVREGLAKGVDPARIEAAASRLGESLTAARTFVADRRPATSRPSELVRALAEAKGAGIELHAADALVRGEGSATEAVRAVEVLTDLGLRGYPVARAAGVVKEVQAREPAAIGRVPSVLETVRIEQALTHVETVDLVARGLRAGGPLQTAARAADKPGRADNAERPNAGKGNSDTFIPPGQLKKQQPQSRPQRPIPPGQAKK
jgi:hypothetical protein